MTIPIYGLYFTDNGHIQTVNIFLRIDRFNYDSIAY
jgi:hypothetical protein